MSNLQKDLQRMQKQVTRGTMSRREFLSRASAMGLMAAAPLLYNEAAQAAPKKGGVYRVGLPAANTGDTLDSGLNSDHYMITMNQGAVKNAMVEVDAKGQAVPELAETLEPSADAKMGS